MRVFEIAEPNDVVDFLGSLGNAEGLVGPRNAVIDSSLEEFHVLANHLCEEAEVSQCSLLLLLLLAMPAARGGAHGERRWRC